MLHHLLKPPSSSISPKLLQPFLLLLPYSTAATATASPSPFLHFADSQFPSSTEIASSVKDWFKTSSLSSETETLSIEDRIYSHLASSPEPSSSLSSLNLRLSEPFVLRVLSHRPHPSAVPPESNLLLLRLRFFHWSDRSSPPYRHSRSVYHAVFRLLARSRLSPLLLDWLRSFRRLHPRPSPRPRLHDTLVLGYSLASRPELALLHLSTMRFRGLDLDSFSYHVLLNSLVDSALFDHARSLLLQISSRGHLCPVTDSIHVKSLCRQHRLDDALSYLRLSARTRRVADRTVALLVSALCRARRLDDARRLLDDFGSDEAYGVWVTSLIAAGRLDDVLAFLHLKKVEEDYVPDSPRYRKLLSRLLVQNRLEQVYDVMVEMMEEGIPPGKGTMNAVLCFFCKAGMVDVALQLYRSRLELGLSPTMWAYNHLVAALCLRGNIEDVYEVLKESMQQGYFPGRQTFNILANLLCRSGDVKKLHELLDGALERKMRPKTAVLARYISALCKAGQLKEACLVPQMAGGEPISLGRYKHTYTSLIRAFRLLGRVEVLPWLVIEMQAHGHTPGRALYVLVVRSLCEAERFEDVLHMLKEQMELNVSDPRTFYNYFMEGAVHAKKLEIASEIHKHMESAGLQPNLDTKIIVLVGYMKSKMISKARSFFSSLCNERAPNTKLYNIFISGLCEAGKDLWGAEKLDLAVETWREMRRNGLIPSLQCYEELVIALCSLRNYPVVFEILDDFRSTGRQVSPFICNVFLLHALKSRELLDAWYSSKDSRVEDNMEQGSQMLMLGRLIEEFSHRIRSRENLENLEEVVEKYFQVDIYTYNILLRALSWVGQMDYACNLFRKIQKKGYEPNRWTYDVIVHGFCKQGQRQEAKRWMEEMMRCGYHPTGYTILIYNDTQ